MKQILQKLHNHETIGKEGAHQVLTEIASGIYNETEIASFLTAFIMRSITVDELTGFRDALLELCVPVDLSEFNTIDLCGTGGDGKNTFNISTLTSFVVAGAGVKVAKHGNYGVSSISGSSNVLESLGIVFTNEEAKLQSQIREAGICFLHAPLFHPAMKNVAPVRKKLGVKTFFNMLGPMVNPSKPKNQMVGVFNLEIARIYQYLYEQSDKNYSIIHALDGFDEISLTGSYKQIHNDGERIGKPSTFGFEPVLLKDIGGGDTVEEAAEIFMQILNGKGTDSQNHVVLANAATAIQTVHRNKEIIECLELAKDSLLGGKALKAFSTLKDLSN